jgi:hypothetical protein
LGKDGEFNEFVVLMGNFVPCNLKYVSHRDEGRERREEREILPSFFYCIILFLFIFALFHLAFIYLFIY